MVVFRRLGFLKYQNVIGWWGSRGPRCITVPIVGKSVNPLQKYCAFSIFLWTTSVPEIRIVRWMCNVKVNSWETYYEWHNLGTIAKQVATVWVCVAKKDDNDWVKKYIVYEVEDYRPRGIPKRLRERMCKKTVKNINWLARMLRIV